MKGVSSFDTWRLLTYTVTDPYENMALDEALLITCNKGLSPPTLRFYTWNPPAISIGYTQNSCRGIDVKLCKRLGIPIVRRITGGRAILHHYRDLTYTLVLKGERALQRVPVSNSYKMVNMCLVSALQNMGIKAELRLRKQILSREKSSFCFLTPANNDIIISGKKVVGSAQRRLKQAFIQHGSIQLSSPPGDDLIKVLRGLGEGNDCFTPPPKSLARGFTWLDEHLPEEIDLLALQETIQKSFENVMGIRLLKAGLIEYEVELKERLLREKYLNDEWNLHKLKVKTESNNGG